MLDQLKFYRTINPYSQCLIYFESVAFSDGAVTCFVGDSIWLSA